MLILSFAAPDRRPVRARALCFFALAVVIGLARTVAAQCPDDWQPLFGVPPGTDAQARAVTLWDPDGSGPLPAQPVVGGDFVNAGGILVNRIARFDGTMWLPFGTGANTGLNGIVRALTTWDPDGAGPQPRMLVAGGDFTGSGSTALNHVAMWNGATWQALDQGFAGSTHVSSLATWDPDGDGPLPERLIAGGSFNATPGGATVNRVAMWDGASWQPLGNGFVNGDTLALTVYDPDGAGPQTPRLVAGGNWITSGTTAVHYVAYWDGAAWQPFAAGFSDRVTGLTTWDPDGSGPLTDQVIATGDFLMSGSTSTQFIARWDGSAWQPLGLGLGSFCYCVTTWDPDGSGPLPAEVLAGGNFSWAGGNDIPIGVAHWNGSTWQGFPSGTTPGPVYALTTWDPDGSGPLTAGPLAVGNISTAGSRTVYNVASWQSNDWRQLGNGLNGNGSASQVLALTLWDPDGSGPAQPQVIAGGGFLTASGKTVNRIARFDGSEWQPLGAGCNNNVYSLTTWDPDGSGPLAEVLVAGGSFTTAGGVTVNQVAYFDGTWHAFGAGIGGTVNALTVWDPDGVGGNPGYVIAGGVFTEAAGKPGNYVALWNGSAWTRMNNAFNSNVFALTTFSPTGNPADARVYAGGQFGSGGSQPYSYIAQWTGTDWAAVGQGVTSYVQAFTRWNETSELVVGGAFTLASQTIANRVAAWTGSAWVNTAFEPGISGTPGIVYALTTWDPDGAGPLGKEVIAGGLFTRTTASPNPALNSIARWHNGAWTPLGAGLSTNGFINALLTWDPDGAGPRSPVIVVGGSFTTGGGLPGAYITAAGVCAQAACPADLDGDGTIGLGDLAALLSHYGLTGGATPADGDLNGDGNVDLSDLAALIGQYGTVCS